MSRQLTFDESEALQMYREGKTDAEIAETVGVRSNVINSWRNRKCLPIKYNYHRREQPVDYGGVSYREALTPEQAERMHEFLCALSWAGGKAIEAGVKPDVIALAKEWSGRLSDKEESVWLREYRRRKKRERDSI